MAAVVTAMKSIQDVGGIIGHAVIVTFHIADSVPWWRRWRRLGWMMRLA